MHQEIFLIQRSKSTQQDRLLPFLFFFLFKTWKIMLQTFPTYSAALPKACTCALTCKIGGVTLEAVLSSDSGSLIRNNRWYYIYASYIVSVNLIMQTISLRCLLSHIGTGIQKYSVSPFRVDWSRSVWYNSMETNLIIEKHIKLLLGENLWKWN